ncbi:dienelactone hydrolase family protein [Ramlibacter sp.]|uniref:dienelactone hydrolase family protein n=1 Tax=Ramlibacter sp. TaxID=1917967 RepID=UPI00345D2924
MGLDGKPWAAARAQLAAAASPARACRARRRAVFIVAFLSGVEVSTIPFMNHRFQCRCAAVRGEVGQPQRGVRAVCDCTDFQACADFPAAPAGCGHRPMATQRSARSALLRRQHGALAGRPAARPERGGAVLRQQPGAARGARSRRRCWSTWPQWTSASTPSSGRPGSLAGRWCPLHDGAIPGHAHSFNNDTPPRYDAAAAKQAWERTISFLTASLA